MTVESPNNPAQEAADRFTPIADAIAELFKTNLGERWKELGVDTTLLTPMLGQTQFGQFTTGGFSTEEDAGPDEDGQQAADGVISLGDIIGEGGMGVVREGVQHGLRRNVAVKQAHPQGGSDAVAALLREAWISGRLEHPNIVPIHALSREGESPLIVMKRIEGTEWSALLRSTDLHASFGVGDDVLGWHLDVLMRLCHAVHFAHSRQILHLDLKPTNIMIGKFGETYLLDWGVAVCFDRTPLRPTYLPFVDDVASIIGTPAYMAPEQAAGDGEGLGPSTDVFQLGAILHEILMGKPPNVAKTLPLALLAAYEALPKSYPPHVSGEIAAIAHKAMAREPSDRYSSVEELRAALANFVDHQSSVALVAEADRRLKTLRPLLAGTIDSTMSALDMSDEVTIQRSMHECRFAYQQALKIWEDNAPARDGLHDLLQLVLKRALEARDLKTAAATLADLPDDDPEMRRRVQQLKTQLKDERRKNAAARNLADQVDLSVHTSVRAKVAVLAGAAWFFWNVMTGVSIREGWLTLDYSTLFGSLLASTVIYGVVSYSVRNTLMKTTINRRALLTLWGAFITTWGLWSASYFLELAPISAVALISVLYVFFLWMAVTTLDSRLWIGIIPTVPLAMLSVADLGHTFEWQGVTGLVAGLTFAWVWRKPEPAKAKVTPRR